MLTGIQRGAVNLVRVCVDRADPAGFAGRFYHWYDTSPVRFDSPDALLWRLDRFYDEINWPQQGLKMRRFETPGAAAPQTGQEGRLPRMERKKVNDLTEQSGERATFVVHVKYRQNATWQGDVLWAEKGQKQNFRSALELIKLMDSALNQVPEEPEPGEEQEE